MVLAVLNSVNFRGEPRIEDARGTNIANFHEWNRAADGVICAWHPQAMEAAEAAPGIPSLQTVSNAGQQGAARV